MDHGCEGLALHHSVHVNARKVDLLPGMKKGIPSMGKFVPFKRLKGLPQTIGKPQENPIAG